MLIAPILPYLADSTEQLADLVGRLVDVGVTGVTGIVLHLRPGTRDWFFGWLGAHHAELVPAYRKLYARGSYADKNYRNEVHTRLDAVKRAAGLVTGAGMSHRAASGPASNRAAGTEQLTLL